MAVAAVKGVAARAAAAVGAPRAVVVGAGRRTRRARLASRQAVAGVIILRRSSDSIQERDIAEPLRSAPAPRTSRGEPRQQRGWTEVTVRTGVPILDAVVLSTRPTKALLGRLRRLQRCEESPNASDATPDELARAEGILFKDTLEWKTAYAELKQLLVTREHVPKGAETHAARVQHAKANRNVEHRRRSSHANVFHRKPVASPPPGFTARPRRRPPACDRGRARSPARDRRSPSTRRCRSSSRRRRDRRPRRRRARRSTRPPS